MDKQNKPKEIINKDTPEMEQTLTEANLLSSQTNNSDKKIKSGIIRYKNADSLYE